MAINFDNIISKASELAESDKWCPATWEKIVAKVQELPTATVQKPFWRAYYLLNDAFKYTHKNAKRQIEGIIELMSIVEDAGARIVLGDSANYCVCYNYPSTKWSCGYEGMALDYFATLEEAQRFAIERSSRRSMYGEPMTAFVEHVSLLKMHDDMNHECDECLGRYVGGEYISKN